MAWLKESDFEPIGEHRCPKKGEYFRDSWGELVGPSPRDFEVNEYDIYRKKSPRRRNSREKT